MATPETTLDVVDELTNDHREMTELLDRIGTTTDPAQKRDMADTAITEIVRHAVAEEMYVYPAMREHIPNGEELVEHDTREHNEMEVTMKDLEDVDPTEARFDQLVAKLRDQLHHHATDEERDQFPMLRERIPRDVLVDLREKVDTAKKIAPTRPHPNAPNNELFHKTLGPGVGLVDRIRDKLTGRR
jgi:hypothetical protein